MKVLSYLKEKSISIIFILYLFFLVLFTKSNFNAAKKGITLWANNVVPSLFPFFVAVELLKHTNLIYFLSIKLDKYMKPIFNLPGVASFPFVMGLISGYPVGAKIVSDLYSNNLCTQKEAERMLAFTNNSGPLFIIGTVGCSFYSNTSIGILLLISHILSSICVGIILGIISRIKSATNKFTANSTQSASTNNFSSLLQDDIKNADLGGILGSAILSAIKSILMIGGFVTIFSVILSILNNTKILTILSYFISNIFHINPDYIVGLLTGFLEFTNGLYKISTINNKMLSINLILSSFIIGFGGISVTLQVLNIISKNKLSIKTYIFGKLLHGTISALFTFLILSIPIFSLNL
jgi:sporulation integral membrane protein YlbJ